MAKSPEKPTDPLLGFPGYLVRRASIATLADLNERLSEFSLRHPEFSLLQLVRANPGIKPSEAGRMLEIQRANMVPLVTRLEKRGLIARTPIDGRSQAINLTTKGRQLAKKAFAVVAAYEQQLIERIPEELRPSVAPILLALWKGDEAEADPKPAGGVEPDNIKFSNTAGG